MDHAAAIEWLRSHISTDVERLGRAAEVTPTLDRMRALVGALGDPQHTAPAVHITGTNGKGSTARVLTALLVEQGLTVGTYLSPHLQQINERIALDGRPVADDELARAVELVAAAAPLSGVEPTYFEVLAAGAYALFADVATQVNVIEVGMGGSWDATNVVAADVAVVTNVGLDHLEHLGPTRRHIAVEKSGIIEPGAHLVCGETDPELVDVFTARSPATTWMLGTELVLDRNDVAVGGRVIDLTTPGAIYTDLFLGLHGAHQGRNAALAVGAAEAFFGRALAEDVVRAALAEVRVPGRFEVVGRHPLVVLDGAHNAAGAAAAAATMRDDFSPPGDIVVVFGCNEGRDPADLLAELAAVTPRTIVATRADWERAVPADEVAAAARAVGLDVEVVGDVAQAVDRARSLVTEEDTILVTGSLYVVGAAREHLGVAPGAEAAPEPDPGGDLGAFDD